MKNRQLICVQCGGEFDFSEREQERFRARGFEAPKRCPECRQKKHKAFSDYGSLKNGDDRRNRHRKRKEENYDPYS